MVLSSLEAGGAEVTALELLGGSPGGWDVVVAAVKGGQALRERFASAASAICQSSICVGSRSFMIQPFVACAPHFKFQVPGKGVQGPEPRVLTVASGRDSGGSSVVCRGSGKA